MEEEGRNSSQNKEKVEKGNVREMMGRKEISSQVCETMKGLFIPVFLSENYYVVSKWK